LPEDQAPAASHWHLAERETKSCGKVLDSKILSLAGESGPCGITLAFSRERNKELR